MGSRRMSAHASRRSDELLEELRERTGVDGSW